VTLYTVGHGTKTTEELVEVLAAAGITVLADVRRHPGSRRYPHLGRDALTDSLPAAGITYQWWGDTLGGRRSRRAQSRHTAWRNAAFAGYADHMDTGDFREAFTALLAACRSEPTAVMCAETVWWRCHRRLLADAAVIRGVPAVHLLSTDNRPAHPLHPDVRAGDDGWPVYDGGQPPLA